MRRRRPALFCGRHFEDVVIVLCVRWYLRYSLSYRDLEEIIAERGLSVDHITIWRWVQRYAPVLNQRIRRELRRPNRSWRVDETYIKPRPYGQWRQPPTAEPALTGVDGRLGVSLAASRRNSRSNNAWGRLYPPASVCGASDGKVRPYCDAILSAHVR